ncbi:coiled-coil domain-containing protein 173 isoform X1 [Bufo gargarizans]|uniref:coiled-coil domain-containing protein 173 isoform X1 n=2 Tax=Bufo gargarizans TaxID=30331 RepID=UPI001CF1D849|nr:coiled-coil domain-containing protein 173 isoform X1 [Bufo gargarizans]
MAAVSGPVVQYGRRKGSSRMQTAERFAGNMAGAAGATVDLREVAVFPRAEWERITNQANSLEKEARKLYEERNEREALHLRSKEMVKNWTNTISGLRKEKLQAKKLREEREEEEKKRIDLEEAQYQAEKRRQAIEDARIKQYFQNDKVKTFHSALMLTEVIKERDAQMELRTKLMSLNNKQDKDTLAKMQRELEESISNDQQKALQRSTERKNNANDLLKQIEEHTHAADLEKRANYRESEDIQRQARLYEWERSKLAKLKTEEKKETMKTHLAHVADRDLLRALEKQMEEENNDLIRRYVLAKKKMANLKKEREAELYRKTVERRDKITELLAAQMKQKLDDEEERLTRALDEMEAKLKKESQEKEEKRKADLNAIAEHRIAMRKKKEKKEKEEKIRGFQALYEIKEADNFFIAQQREKMKRAEDECKNVQTTQIQQMAEKKKMTQAELEAEFGFAKQNEALLSKEEEVFQEYAKNVIDSVTKTGGNPLPLLKAAQKGTGGGRGPVYSDRGGIRPSYQVQDTSAVQLPAYQNTTTQEIKEMNDCGDVQQGKRRLGFTF